MRRNYVDAIASLKWVIMTECEAIHAAVISYDAVSQHHYASLMEVGLYGRT